MYYIFLTTTIQHKIFYTLLTPLTLTYLEKEKDEKQKRFKRICTGFAQNKMKQMKKKKNFLA